MIESKITFSSAIDHALDLYIRFNEEGAASCDIGLTKAGIMAAGEDVDVALIPKGASLYDYAAMLSVCDDRRIVELLTSRVSIRNKVRFIDEVHENGF